VLAHCRVFRPKRAKNKVKTDRRLKKNNHSPIRGEEHYHAISQRRKRKQISRAPAQKNNPDAQPPISIYNQPLILEKRKNAAILATILTILSAADSAEQNRTNRCQSMNTNVPNVDISWRLFRSSQMIR
jgi:hypothetical protein